MIYDFENRLGIIETLRYFAENQKESASYFEHLSLFAKDLDLSKKALALLDTKDVEGFLVQAELDIKDAMGMISMKELIAQLPSLVDKVAPSPTNLDEICRCFDIHYFSLNYDNWEEKDFLEYPINTWICTDTEVGFHAIKFKNELVALSFQMARKSDVRILWLSTELAHKVRDFLLSKVQPEYSFEVLDLEGLISAHWLDK